MGKVGLHVKVIYCVVVAAGFFVMLYVLPRFLMSMAERISGYAR